MNDHEKFIEDVIGNSVHFVCILKEEEIKNLDFKELKIDIEEVCEANDIAEETLIADVIDVFKEFTRPGIYRINNDSVMNFICRFTKELGSIPRAPAIFETKCVVII